MPREKKLEAPITLFAAIKAEQHEALRTIAFQERRSIADVVRQAINEFIRRRPKSLKHHEPARAGRLEEFRSEIDRRLTALDRAKAVDGEKGFAHIRRKSEERHKKRAGAATPLRKERGVWVFRTGKELPASVTDKVLRKIREKRA